MERKNLGEIAYVSSYSLNKPTKLLKSFKENVRCRFRSVWMGLYTCCVRVAGQCSGVYSGVWRPVSARVHHRPGCSIRRHVQQQHHQTQLIISIILVPVSLPSHADHRIRGDALKGQQSTGTVYNIFIDGYRKGAPSLLFGNFFLFTSNLWL